jgi:hypothetical protein
LEGYRASLVYSEAEYKPRYRGQRTESVMHMAGRTSRTSTRGQKFN